MKNPLVILLVALCLGAPLSLKAQYVYIPEDVHFKAPKVPEFIEFAGQTWRFDRPDLYERMDRELITFTYSHTNSILMLKRAKKIFAQVEPVLRQQGVPDDLKYLMAIESNLDPKALSAAGAAGLWQFMRATGQSYGLEVATEVDERYNIEKATVAACKYLKEAYAKYGDWMTVAASYNAGQGGITKRLSDQRQKRATDLFLPTETSRYMFRILTAKYFFEHPEAFGFHLEEDEIYPYLPPRETVSVSGPIPNLTDFAEEHGTTYFHLKEANLWLRSDKLTNKAGKTYKIIIPTTKF
ncbi:MAG: lytic transglycosylase domain-containing protein [Bacteroidales bacterium]|nr:lytic transglycosylase domain-containing protein [Bacteroidales bacterium]MBR1578246.1 lytic transglycosylase domain-containing protein [Bacteroidales bacterium]